MRLYLSKDHRIVLAVLHLEVPFAWEAFLVVEEVTGFIVAIA